MYDKNHKSKVSSVRNILKKHFLYEYNKDLKNGWSKDQAKKLAMKNLYSKKIVEKRKTTAAQKREYENTHTPAKKRMCLRSFTNMRELKRCLAPVEPTPLTKQVPTAEKSCDRMRGFRPCPDNASQSPRLSDSRPITRRTRVMQNHDTPLTNRHGTPLSQKKGIREDSRNLNAHLARNASG